MYQGIWYYERNRQSGFQATYEAQRNKENGCWPWDLLYFELVAITFLPVLRQVYVRFTSEFQNWGLRNTCFWQRPKLLRLFWLRQESVRIVSVSIFHRYAVSPNKQPYDTRFIESFLLCSFTMPCLRERTCLSQLGGALRKAADVIRKYIPNWLFSGLRKNKLRFRTYPLTSAVLFASSFSSLKSILSTIAFQLASTMFSETPAVPQSFSPSPDSISTLTTARFPFQLRPHGLYIP